MDQRYHRGKLILIVCTFCFCLLTAYSFGRFETNFFEMEMEKSQEELKKSAEVEAKFVQNRYENMIVSLEALAENLQDFSLSQEEEVLRQLSFLAEVGRFSYVGVSDQEGNIIDSAGQKANIQGRDYFQEAMAGKTVISDVMESKVRGGKAIQVMALPIMEHDGPRGIVFGILNIDSMDEILEGETGSDIDIQIIDSQGNYILRKKKGPFAKKNAWDEFEEYEFIEGNEEEIRENIKAQKAGNLIFKMGEEEQFGYYMPMGLRGYYICSIVNGEKLRQWQKQVNAEASQMMLLMTAAFFTLGIGLYLYNKKVQEELRRSHAEAVSSKEMMGIAIKESSQVVFEYSIQTGILKKKAGVSFPLFSGSGTEAKVKAVLDRGILAEESVPVFLELFETIKTEESVEGIFKAEEDGCVKWYRILMKNIYDENHDLLNTVGIVDDVTEKKVQEELLEIGEKEKKALQKQAERDGLTQLYNAAAVKAKVQELLEHADPYSDCHLFVLLDLDNFKQINDTFGHQYGDQVLREVADVLKKTFRRDDILGRLGGDEFVFLLRSVPNFQVMEPIFEKLCRQLQKTYTKDGKSVTISASLGAACAPGQGSTFTELYSKSDQALYEVKNQLKNGYRLYGN